VVVDVEMMGVVVVAVVLVAAGGRGCEVMLGCAPTTWNGQRWTLSFGERSSALQSSQQWAPHGPTADRPH
jgi:hypothetical protein